MAGESGRAGKCLLHAAGAIPHATAVPAASAYQGIEGNVTACFTVTATGSVIDPYVAGASSPQARRELGAAALSAVQQWKFFPRVMNGQAASTPRVCQVIRFRLGNR